MKILITSLLMVAFSVFAQEENPWKNPNTENPWGEAATEGKVEVPDSMDTPSAQTTWAVNESVQDQLLTKAENQAKSEYNAGGDFTVGLLSGAILNVGGLVIVGITSASNSKTERRIIEETKADSTYKSIDPEVLEKNTKRTLKKKKFLHGIGGTAIGAGLQILYFSLLF